MEEKYGEVFSIYNQHDRETNLLKPDGGFSYSNDELKKIGKGIEENNPFVRDKYGIPEDSVINGFIDKIRERPLQNIMGTNLGGGSNEPFEITEDDVKAMKGKMITYTDSGGTKRYAVIDDYEEKTDSIGATGVIRQTIWVLDIETGKRNPIYLTSTV